VEPVDTNTRVVWSFAALYPGVCRFDIGTFVISIMARSSETRFLKTEQ
jgi:hypothetical protein